MASTVRYRPLGVMQRLAEDACQFDFFQAVRILRLQRWRQQGTQASHKEPQDAVRFKVQQTLSFPASAIQSCELAPNAPASLEVNFMGLTGPSGALPVHYTEELITRKVQQRDDSGAAFFDIFNHRAIDLFYGAWEKYRGYITFERERRDPVTQAVRHIAGVGFEVLQTILQAPHFGNQERSISYYAGILSQRPLSTEAVARVMTEYFGQGVQIVPFLPAWLPMGEAGENRLGQRNALLGVNLLVGSHMQSRQSRLKIRIGPLDLSTFKRFLPHGDAFAALKGFLKFCWGHQFSLEVELILHQDDVGPPALGGDNRLGWYGWVGSHPAREHAADTRFEIY